MFLVDPKTRRLVAASDRVVDADGSSDDVEQELFLQQVETQSEPHRSSADLLADLRDARRRAAVAARAVGARLAAMPTPVLPDDDGVVTAKQRYRTMVSRYGAVGRDALVCGMHVHVGIDGEDEGVAVIDRLRPWLPVVLAMSSSSPFQLGVDTAFASWRSEVWESWPSAGAVEPFGNPDTYHRAVEALVATGGAIDEGMIYFDARLARSFPTVEVRVADVCADLTDTIVVAAVVRALVETVAAAWRRGDDVSHWRVDVLRAARWRARRDGLTGSLVHPATAELAPASQVLDDLQRFVRPALHEAGDADLVAAGITRLVEYGTGAQRQRRIAGPDLDLVAVVDDVLHRTSTS
jgi:glutamate---cysteine ligase / carboxylate-amine ligase